MELRRDKFYAHVDNTKNSKKGIFPLRRYNSEPLFNRINSCDTSNSEDFSSSKRVFYSGEALERLMKLSGASDNRLKQYSSKSRLFADDFLRCSQEYYPDLLLQPDNISKAYEMYLIGRGGSKLDFTVLGRISMMEEGKSPLSNEKFPFIDSALRRNLLGHDNREKSGIILRIPDEDWNIINNISWVLGLIHASCTIQLCITNS